MKVSEVRTAVFARDGMCIAAIIDKEAGPCYDRWGTVLPSKLSLTKAWLELEMDYVRLDAHAGHHESPKDHVMICPGHHRGTGPSAGYIWATAHRHQQRAYLERVNASRQG